MIRIASICLFFIMLVKNISAIPINIIENEKKLLTVPDSLKENILRILIDYYSDQDSTKCLHYIKQLDKLSEKIGNISIKGKAVVLEAHFYKKRGYFNKAIELLKKAEEIYIQNNDTKNVGIVNSDLGAVYADKGEYSKAASHLLKALKIFDMQTDELQRSKILLNLGLVFYYQKNYDLAQYYYYKCLKIKEKYNDKKGIALVYNNLGLVYYFKNRKDIAVEYFHKALAIYQKLEMKRQLSMPLFNIAEIYFEKKQYDSALFYYQKSFEIDTSLHDIASSAKSLTKLAVSYAALKKYDKAISYGEQALKYANEADSKEDIKDAYYALGEIFKELKRYEKAIDYIEKANQIKDTLYNIEVSRQVTELQTKYETEKKYILLSKQYETIKHQRSLTLVLTIGIILTLGLFVMAVFEYVQKKKAYQILELQKKNITDSINYASRIQAAMLPPEDLLKQLLPNSFVLYMPKELVSGDFYWVFSNGPKIYVALADCTGHGVPGAFMSMLGFAFLNEIVNRSPESRANEILNQMRNKVKQSLHQHENSETKDGMDIALIIYNPETLFLEYAGANNPLIICRNGQIIYLSADKMPIGFYYLEDTNFSLKTIQLQPFDILYIFSDGYVDQFGGEKYKKLGRGRFEKILLEASKLPIKAQQYFLEEKFLEWSINIEQIDDITIMGIQI